MFSQSITAGLVLLASIASAEDAKYTNMGPAAFMWPPDRVWSGDADNTAPCGSIAAPNNSNRTDFPLDKGQVALVAQDESYDIQLSVAYMSDPKSNSDFKVITSPEQFREMELGHTCVPVGDIPDYVKSGDYATFQIKYIADFDKPENQTFYACADVKFVEEKAFTISIPCFNATEPDADDEAGPGFDYHSSVSSTTAAPTSTATGSSNSGSDSSNDGSSSSGGGGLSKGAIAGIVVGAVAGVAIIALAALFLYRRRLQQNRVIRQQKFEQGVEGAVGKDSTSNNSVRMNNL
ncbi:unnamed protein product [Clonostachys rosea]|uniref:Copper acquisition factor BIM1-like domain-containing protein n=1 Tax=Bionectria ochroleuca TaxID=29856 RepID=A0ABY6TYE8_BIOOC|nr:unnamed protein product [Clonostachys rosea]